MTRPKESLRVSPVCGPVSRLHFQWTHGKTGELMSNIVVVCACGVFFFFFHAVSSGVRRLASIFEWLRGNVSVPIWCRRDFVFVPIWYDGEAMAPAADSTGCGKFREAICWVEIFERSLTSWLILSGRVTIKEETTLVLLVTLIIFIDNFNWNEGTVSTLIT